MKTRIDIARFLRDAMKTSVYLAAGAVLLMTAARAAAQVVVPAGPAVSGQTQTPDVRRLADRDDNTTVAPATDLATATQSAPKVGLRVVLGIRLSKDEHGATILQMVQEGSPAARAGLRAGDKILAVNGVRVRSTEEFLSLLHNQDWRNDFRILIDRNSHARQLVVRGGTLNSPTSTGKQNDHAAIGIVMSEKSLARGVLVSKIYPGSPADEAGVRSGDVILAVDGRRVTTAEELRSIILQHRSGDELDLSVSRQGWHRNFLLISMEQSDLAKLPAPREENPAGAVAPASSAPASSAPAVFVQPGIVEPFSPEATPGHTFGEVGAPQTY